MLRILFYRLRCCDLTVMLTGSKRRSPFVHLPVVLWWEQCEGLQPAACELVRSTTVSTQACCSRAEFSQTVQCFTSSFLFQFKDSAIVRYSHEQHPQSSFCANEVPHHLNWKCVGAYNLLHAVWITPLPWSLSKSWVSYACLYNLQYDESNKLRTLSDSLSSGIHDVALRCIHEQ